MAFDKNNPKNRKRRKVCQFCVDKATYIDYKDTAKLRRFLSERGKILPRRTTGTCAPALRARLSLQNKLPHPNGCGSFVILVSPSPSL